MNADTLLTRLASNDPFRGHGYQFCTPHERAPLPSHPVRLCTICKAKLASDNRDDHCSCHEYAEGIDIPLFAIALSQCCDGSTLNELARVITGERALNATESRGKADARNAEWARLIDEDGWTFAAVAEEFKRELVTVKEGVRRYRERHPEHKRKPSPPQRKLDNAPRNALWLEMWRGGRTQQAIADEYGVSKTTVYDGICRARSGMSRHEWLKRERTAK